jgi:hypothetical protein
MSLGTHVRLCLKDLYTQDVVEMIERETRKYEVEAIEHPDHPDFKRAFEILWNAFGPAGEMESEAVIRKMLLDDRRCRSPSGTYARYFLLVARDRATGAIRGVRDGRVLVNPAYSPDLCVVYLSHIFMLPEARGTVLTYWLRIAPLDLAVTFLHQLHQRGVIALPDRTRPASTSACASTSRPRSSSSAPTTSSRCNASYSTGAGGFDVIDPRHFRTASRTSAIPR